MSPRKLRKRRLGAIGEVCCRQDQLSGKRGVHEVKDNYTKENHYTKGHWLSWKIIGSASKAK